MLTITDKRKKRFWNKVHKTPTCWLWTASPTKDGYGKVSFTEGENKYTYRAHRFAYLITRGDPENNLVCHSCDTPLCVNPDHLFLGDNTANQQDMIQKRRDNRAKGETLSNLTSKKVLEIRMRVANGEIQRKICKEYGLTIGGISHIVRRNTWKHI
jgi:HNH endonuclease